VIKSNLICQKATACNCIFFWYHSGSYIFLITEEFHHDKAWPLEFVPIFLLWFYLTCLALPGKSNSMQVSFSGFVKQVD